MKTLPRIRRIEPSIDGMGGVWRVKIIRCEITYDARFADTSYESTEQARCAAQEFLDALLARLPAPRRRCKIGNDGMPGAVFYTDGRHPSWNAELHIEKKKYRKSFSISKYGSEEARLLALETRDNFIKEHHNEQSSALPSKQEIDLLAESIKKKYNERPVYVKNKKCFNDEAMYGLTRREADAHGKGGFWVALLIRNGQEYRKQFADSTYGGKEQAFAAASCYRDEILVSVKPMSRRKRQETLISRNTSGVAGVYILKRKGIPVAWGAGISLHGKVQRQFFHFKDYGQEQAFELAVQARQKMLEMVEGDCALSPAARSAPAAKQQSPRHKNFISEKLEQFAEIA